MTSFHRHQLAHRHIAVWNRKVPWNQAIKILQQDTMSNEEVCAAAAARAATISNLDDAMKKAVNVIEHLMTEDEKEWKEIEDAYRSVKMAMEAFDEANDNLLSEVWELATKNGQDEKAAFDEEAKRIQPLITRALLAWGDIRVLNRGINDNESYVTLAARDAHKSLLAYCSVSTSSEINPEPKPSAPDESDRGYEAMEDPRIINLHRENPCQELQEYPQEESRNPAPGSSSDSFVGEGPLGKKKKRSRHNPRHRNSLKEQQLTIQRKSWTNPPRQGNSSSVKEFPKSSVRSRQRARRKKEGSSFSKEFHRVKKFL